MKIPDYITSKFCVEMLKNRNDSFIHDIMLCRGLCGYKDGPDWECWVHTDDTYPESVRIQAAEYDLPYGRIRMIANPHFFCRFCQSMQKWQNEQEERFGKYDSSNIVATEELRVRQENFIARWNEILEETSQWEKHTREWMQRGLDQWNETKQDQATIPGTDSNA